MQDYENQIKLRKRKDDEAFLQAFEDLSGAILGETKVAAQAGKSLRTERALTELFKYLHVTPAEPPSVMTDFNTRLEYMLRPTGIMRRSVDLSGKWWKDAVGPMISTNAEGEAIALLPGKFGGYYYYDYKTGRNVRVDDKTAQCIDNSAICFYRNLPNKSLGIWDLLRFMVEQIDLGDLLFMLLMAGIVTIMGMVTPKVTQLLYSVVIPLGDLANIAPIATLLITVALSSQLISTTRMLITNRISTKVENAVASAAMARLLNLPASFFKKYQSGEMSSRVQSITSLCSMLESALLTSGLSSIFSIAYIFQINSFVPSMTAPALIVLFLQVGVMIAIGYLQLNHSRKGMKEGAKLSGLVFLLFSGIQKIKLAGAEKRAFAKWAESYKKEAEISYNPPLMLKLQGVLSGLISLAATILFYYLFAQTGAPIADYMAFNASYGMVSGAIMSMAAMASTFYNIKPVMEMAEPILKETPEVSAAKKTLASVSGGFEMNDVSFRYTDDGPLVLDNIDLKVKPGQYVAIVGKTGCGKSTLMRLLLGFEKPTSGAIYYDKHDLSEVDLRSVRRNIGVVMQSGKLFAGDIYSNIVISAPWLKLDQAWEAAEKAGIADDIRAMPMGMHTMISEGAGGISGGQKQRIMIARAIAPGPKMLFFDEATSALDNIAQKVVSDSLGKLKCTRVVIAHRLSTIKECDRIIVLDGGHIIEDGTYDELIAHNGFFAELVERQRVDV